jgi:biotin carboxylase
MATFANSSDRSQLPRRVLLLLTSRTYRAPSFLAAADQLGIEVVKAVEMHEQLAEYWNFPLGLNFANPDSATEKILEYAKINPLGAILSVDDSGSILAATASQALGLPHNSPDAAEAARDKYKMRQMLAASGVQIPGYAALEFDPLAGDEQLKSLSSQVPYPCVVKPLSLSGSRGVIRADNPDQFIIAGRRLRRLLFSIYADSDADVPFIVEEYISGVEIALEGILDDGELCVLAIFDKPDPLVGPYFEETIYVTPSRLPEKDLEDIKVLTARAASAIGLREGPVHCEIRLNERGPWLIEIAGRSIGGLCSQTLRFDIGVTLEELILRQAFGLEFRSFKQEKQSSGVMMMPIPEAGILKEVKGCDRARSIPLIDGVRITAKLNYSLTPLPEGDSYLGFIFASGENSVDVEIALRKAYRQIEFVIVPELPLLNPNLKLNQSNTV